MVAAGAARLGSSSVPARTKMTSGRCSASLKTGVPHREQNRLCMIEPLSARITWSVNGPDTVTLSLRKSALTAPVPAPRYWQTRHQQYRAPSGASASISNRTARHRHPPAIAKRKLP